MIQINKKPFDRTNAILAGVIFITSFVVYAMTVQRSIPFWDCGEFIACSYILGIPHPPGTPLFVLIGRLFSIIPFVADISYRINYISVISSALTAMLSYLLIVKLVGYFFKEDENKGFNRYIAYIGGIAGALFVAFSRTNWGNAVEAEVYGLALALSVGIVYLTVVYFEKQGTVTGTKMMIMAIYLALLGIGIHMTVYLVVPSCAIFFVLKKEATWRDWLLLAGFVILELIMILAFADGRGGSQMFYLFTVLLGAVLLVLLYKKINWANLLAIGSISSVMMAFSKYFLVTPIALLVLIAFGILATQRGWCFQWKTGVLLVLIAAIGLSVHAFVTVRSSQNPAIDENNPSRDWPTFVNFLDRKQYGAVSMVDRMFQRRGALENQFGRHAHMGFWSYFEDQYSKGGWNFILPFFLLGIFGVYTLIRRKFEIGMSLLTLLLLCSVGLVLYMNFADGTRYNFNTGDAYLEVRDRDYFFTPAFVFFGIAMGLGVSAVMAYLRDKFGRGDLSTQKIVVVASSILVLLPAVSFAHNYHANDRSRNTLAYQYAANLLNTCDPQSIFFTAGDNDTFPLWCIQEVYGFRTDVTIVNLSLLNTDWYTEQMKKRYNVPISLTDEQIRWYPFEYRPGLEINRPKQMFNDRPRQRRTYLFPGPGPDGQFVKVQDMMVDEIVLGNKWEKPLFFSSPPWAESPLKLREHATSTGIIFRLDKETLPGSIDVERGYDLFMNTYTFKGMENSDVYRDENATGLFQMVGNSGVRVADELVRQGDTVRAKEILQKLISVYPEYWQSYAVLAGIFDQEGDTASGTVLLQQCHDTLAAFLATNEENLLYQQDLGLMKADLGRRLKNQEMIEEGLRMLWAAFEANANSTMAFRKLISVLVEQQKYSDIHRAATVASQYKINLQDPYLQRLLGISDPGGVRPDF